MFRMASCQAWAGLAAHIVEGFLDWIMGATFDVPSRRRPTQPDAGWQGPKDRDDKPMRTVKCPLGLRRTNFVGTSG